MIDTMQKAAAVLERIDVSNFKVPIALAMTRLECNVFWMHIAIQVNDRETGKPIEVASDHSIEKMKEDDFIAQVMDRVKYMIDHEVQECFRVDGKIWKDPH